VHGAALVALTGGLLASLPVRAAEPWSLEADYVRAKGEGGVVTELCYRVRTEKEWSTSEVRSFGRTYLSRDCETVLHYGDRRVQAVGCREELPLVIEQTAQEPPPVMTGRIGQTFTVTTGTFTRAGGTFATWYRQDVPMTLTLRRDGPEGEVLAERQIPDHDDDAWEYVECAPQGPGTYYLEASGFAGDFAWWSASGNPYAGGTAFVDGQPVPDLDRKFRVEGTQPGALYDIEIELTTPETLTYRLLPREGQAGGLDLDYASPWNNEGYDVDREHNVLFSHVISAGGQYFPCQQLKRRTTAGIAIVASAWLRIIGNGPHDVILSGPQPVGLSWDVIGPDTLHWHLSTPGSELSLKATPGGTYLPPQYPRFVSSDELINANLSRFYYERAFTYPPGAGSAPWFESMSLIRDWNDNGLRAGNKSDLEGYPITDEGYVHTWGAAPGWPFPDNAKYDTRHFDSNARFITACWRYYCWTRDRAFLDGQIARLRLAMEYQLGTLRGSNGLIIAASKDVTGLPDGVGDNYWDILPFGHLDAYANAIYYASLSAMAEIESLYPEAPGRRAPAYYETLRTKAWQAYKDTFWDEAQGRFIGCVDVNGGRHDYGFTFVNLEAMAYGLATPEMAQRVYAWMETQPTSTGEADTYSKWVFAPRANTIHNPERSEPQEPVPSWWFFGWGGTPFGDQCQDGGAILYTSYFDLMARLQLLGPDNAYDRLRAILGRYAEPDRLCGGPPLYHGETPQQENPGQVGVDMPFPESGLVPCAFLYGVVGAEAHADGLHVRPALPAALTKAGVLNVSFAGARLDLVAQPGRLTVRCTQNPGRTRFRLNGQRVAAASDGTFALVRDLPAGDEVLLAPVP